MKLKNHYSELTPSEKYIVDEYTSWCKSDAPIAYKYTKAMEFMKRAMDAGISHLL